TRATRRLAAGAAGGRAGAGRIAACTGAARTAAAAAASGRTRRRLGICAASLIEAEKSGGRVGVPLDVVSRAVHREGFERAKPTLIFPELVRASELGVGRGGRVAQ